MAKEGETPLKAGNNAVSIIGGIVAVILLLLYGPMDGRIKDVEEFENKSHVEHEDMRTRTTILENNYTHILKKLDELIEKK